MRTTLCTALFVISSSLSVSAADIAATDVNPCNPKGLERPPIWAALVDHSCESKDTRVQAGQSHAGSKGPVSVR